MDFGTALEGLKDGYQAKRAGWNGEGMKVELQTPDAHSKMSRPYLFMTCVDGGLVPWSPTQSDVLADDWVVL